jgi:hypothetical protein
VCAQVGLLDIDICGPSAPKLTGLEGEEVHQSGSGWSPVYVQDNLAVMSIGTHNPGTSKWQQQQHQSSISPPISLHGTDVTRDFFTLVVFVCCRVHAAQP